MFHIINPTAWLALDEEDNDPTRFTTYLVAALQHAAGAETVVGKGALNMLQAPQQPAAEDVLIALINEITTVPGGVILMLDDYHLIDSPPVDKALTFLLDHMPPNMYLVMAGFFRAFTNLAMFLLIVPLLGLGALYWYSRPQPRKLAVSLVIGLPVPALILSGIEPVLRVSQRVDDGDRRARLVHGNGVDLIWAPARPGWPPMGTSWYEARQVCQHLSEGGLPLDSTPQNKWRLPAVEEAVSSMARHGRNSADVWDGENGKAVYETTPDKESPFWDTHSLVIYWWTATEVDDEHAYMIAYDGAVWPRTKQLKQGYLGFRCVSQPAP